jgi:hypothetical protein
MSELQKFVVGDIIVSIPQNEKAVVIAHEKGDTYLVKSKITGEEKQIIGKFWVLEPSNLILHEGERVRYNKTGIVGIVQGPALDCAARVGDKTEVGTMPGPEPIYFIEIDGSADYLIDDKTSGRKRKIVDARNVSRFDLSAQPDHLVPGFPRSPLQWKLMNSIKNGQRSSSNTSAPSDESQVAKKKIVIKSIEPVELSLGRIVKGRSDESQVAKKKIVIKPIEPVELSLSRIVKGRSSTDTAAFMPGEKFSADAGKRTGVVVHKAQFDEQDLNASDNETYYIVNMTKGASDKQTNGKNLMASSNMVKENSSQAKSPETSPETSPKTSPPKVSPRESPAESAEEGISYDQNDELTPRTVMI